MGTARTTEAIGLVVTALEKEHVVYAVTGSVASSIHGEPITSIDVDIAVRMSPEVASRLARDMAPRFYADPDMLREAAVNHAIANLYDHQTGLKFDLSVLSDIPYHEQVLSRRVRIQEPSSGLAIWVVSPEDAVLMKLVWRKDSRSRKQWDNALSVVRVKGHELDWSYLRRWAAELGVEADLDQLVREAGV